MSLFEWKYFIYRCSCCELFDNKSNNCHSGGEKHCIIDEAAHFPWLYLRQSVFVMKKQNLYVL